MRCSEMLCFAGQNGGGKLYIDDWIVVVGCFVPRHNERGGHSRSICSHAA
jgi:hypothetical protein